MTISCEKHHCYVQCIHVLAFLVFYSSSSSSSSGEQGGHADGSPLLSLTNTSGKVYMSGLTASRKGHGSNTSAYRDNSGSSYGQQEYMMYTPESTQGYGGSSYSGRGSSSRSYSRGKGPGASASASSTAQAGSSLHEDYGYSNYGAYYGDSYPYVYEDPYSEPVSTQ